MPDHTAIRTALWRALHMEIDPPPHIFTDNLAAKLVGEKNWRDRPDMEPNFSKQMRASITGRARFIEDLVEKMAQKEKIQYVILGAGLDTFAQRREKLLQRVEVFEVDEASTQEWKKKRLKELALPMPKELHFVSVDFEKESWWDKLIKSGLDLSKPTAIVSTGVSMYLSKEANLATLKQVSKLAPGSTFAMTFMLSLELLEGPEKSIMEFVMQKAAEASTPFLSLFKPEEILELAKEAGFKKVQYVSGQDIYQRYFSGRPDALNAGTAEAFLVVQT